MAHLEKVLAAKADDLILTPLEPHDRSRELIHKSYPLTSACTEWHMNTPHPTYK